MNTIGPRWLYWAMAASLTAVGIAHFVLHSDTAEWISFADKEIAYLLASGFCWRIAGEYRRQPLLRLAWLLLAANGGVSLLRHALELSTFDLVPQIHLYRQVAITAALLLLLGGMATMARAFLGTGLGFRIHRIDILAVAAVFVLVSVILLFHENLSEASMPLLAPRNLQLFSQVVIAVAGAFAVVLHRIILEMGGGKLAIAMRFLAGHIVGRVLLVLMSQILRPYISTHPDWAYVTHIAFDGTIWLFALAACYRVNMFSAALRQAPPKPEEILALSLDEQWSRIQR